LTVILAAHGSPDPRHASTIRAIRDAVAERLADVRLGWLGHQQPGLAALVGERVLEGDRPIVVPLLLAPAFHATVDVPAASGHARVAEVLAPDPRLLRAMDHRLAQAAGDRHLDGLVLAAAGSSDAAADRLVRSIAAEWSTAHGIAVEVGYASAKPSVGEAIAALHASGATSIAVGCFMLAPGRLHDAVEAAAGDHAVAAPLGSHPEVIDVIVARAVEAGAHAGASVPG
jgi:sirohydrochlorin ferrochelatase